MQAPDSFNFSNPGDWGRWKKRFEQFRIASGLEKDEQSKQVNILLYCMGEETETILDSMKATDGDKGDYPKVQEKFDEFFQVRKIVIYERARFNRRSQQEGETAKQFIMNLYKLADNCDYNEFKDDMIRDRLVVGILDMQLDPKLDLEKAKKMVLQQESVKDQSRELKRETTIKAPSHIKGWERGKQKSRSPPSQPTQSRS